MRLCDEPHAHLILSVHYPRDEIIQSTYVISLKNLKRWLVFRHLERYFFRTWYQFEWPWLSFKITVIWKIKNFGVHFLANLSIDLDEIQCVIITCWFVGVHATYILRMFYSRDMMCQDTCEMICFKLGMMLNTTTKLYTVNFDLLSAPVLVYISHTH